MNTYIGLKIYVFYDIFVIMIVKDNFFQNQKNVRPVASKILGVGIVAIPPFFTREIIQNQEKKNPKNSKCLKD